ncbi:MAG: hypothetical protein R3A47_05540 [Polyangiales bacterium]
MLSPSQQPAYPTRASIKGVQPDGMPTDELKAIGATGGVAINTVWSEWEPTLVLGPNCPANYYLYDGHCYKIQTRKRQPHSASRGAGIPITAIVFEPYQHHQLRLYCQY